MAHSRRRPKNWQTPLGGQADRHWTCYHKFFYRAAWNLQELSAILLQRVIHPLALAAGKRDATTGKLVLDLHIDDTTVGRYGKHVAHTGWYKDASCNGPAYKGTVIHWAHNWLVGCVTLRLADWPMVRWALPTFFALYRKAQDCNASHPWVHNVFGGLINHRVTEDTQTHRDDEKKRRFV